MAESYSTTPAELLSVDDPYSAWCINEVAYLWGMSVEAAVQRARSAQDDHSLASQAATAELNRLLRDDVVTEEEDVQQAADRGKFRDPAADFAAMRARGRPA